MWCTVDDIGDVITGGTPSKSNSLFYGGDYPFFKPTDLEQGVNVTSSIDGLSELGFQNSRQLPPLSILVTCIGATIGKTGLIRKAGSCNQQINAIVPNGLMYAELIYFFITSEWFQQCIKSNSSATTLPILNKNNFAKLYFPIPPQKEQNRILTFIKSLWNSIDEIDVDVLDLKNYLNSTKNNTLELAISGRLVPQDPADEPAEELLRRINPAAVPADKSHYKFDVPKHWTLSNLGDLFNHNTGKALNRSNRDGKLLSYITTSNLYWDRFELDSIKQMYFKESEIEKCTVRYGDLLVCEGGDIGRSAIWSKNYTICIQNHIHKLRPIANDFVLPRFYYYCFLLYKNNNLIGGRGIGIQGLSSNELHKLIIPLPPLNEQKRIVAKVDELFAVIDQIQQSLE